jgi:hypothetical protein
MSSAAVVAVRVAQRLGRSWREALTRWVCAIRDGCCAIGAARRPSFVTNVTSRESRDSRIPRRELFKSGASADRAERDDVKRTARNSPFL